MSVSRAAARAPLRALSLAAAPAAAPAAGPVVLKFGGSSLGTEAALRRSGAILLAAHAAGARPVGVLSAMLGVTNRLLAAARAAAAGDAADAAARAGALVDAHVAVARAVTRGDAHAGEAAAAAVRDEGARLARALGELGRAAAAGGRGDAPAAAAARAAGQAATDEAASAGERWAARLMEAHLCAAPLRAPAAYVCAATVVVTDGVAGGARPLLAPSRAAAARVLAPLLARGALPIVTGFYGGAEAGGRVTTLGRGGSDLSAAVVGASVGAAAIRLYKVEHDGATGEWVAGWVGVVHDAAPEETIAALRYEEARELAHFGRGVLHLDTVVPAVDARIPIEVRNTLDAAHPGTTISGAAGAAPGGAPRGAAVATVTGTRLAAYEAAHGAAGCGVRDADAAALGLARADAALVALVGHGVMRDATAGARALAALAAAGVPARLPEYVNGSQHSLSLLVPEARRKDALRALHRAFVAAA